LASINQLVAKDTARFTVNDCVDAALRGVLEGTVVRVVVPLQARQQSWRGLWKRCSNRRVAKISMESVFAKRSQAARSASQISRAEFGEWKSVQKNYENLAI